MELKSNPFPSHGNGKFYNNYRFHVLVWSVLTKDNFEQVFLDLAAWFSSTAKYPRLEIFTPRKWNRHCLFRITT